MARETGNENNNRITGTDNPDFLCALGGNNTLVGRADVDSMVGGKGNDTANGNRGNDTVFGGSGTDTIKAESSDDSVSGGSGGDRLYVLAGSDRMSGGYGIDRISGGISNDPFSAFSDRYHEFGGTGFDAFFFHGTGRGTAVADLTLIRDLNGAHFGAANGQDKLVFASGLEVGSFAYIGSASFSGGFNSQARFAGNRLLEVDRDGDANADITVRINGFSGGNMLTATDFVRL